MERVGLILFFGGAVLAAVASPFFLIAAGIGAAIVFD